MKPNMYEIFIFLLVFVSAIHFSSFAQQKSIDNEVYRIELKDGSVLIGSIISEDDVAIQFKTMSNIQMNIEKDQIKKRENITRQMPDDKVYRIELKDGSVMIGTIISENDAEIQFKTMSNVKMSIRKDQIKGRKDVSGQIVQGQLRTTDPNLTRMLFTPTARPLKAGKGYFSVYEIFFPFIAVGITDFLSISGGMSIFPGVDEQLLYIAPKITPIHLENFDLAAGVLYMKVPDEDEGAGIVYGVGTYGSNNSSMTFGLGFGFAGGDFADKPVVVIGGEHRISNSLKLISENWIIPEAEFVPISFGIRFFGSNLAADFALLFPAGADTEGWPFLPWIGFAYNF